MRVYAVVVLLAWSCVDARPQYYPSGEECPGRASCVAVRQCPAAVRAITAGGPRPSRCGFRGFDELVCCAAPAPAPAPATRPAGRPRPAPTPAPAPRPSRTPSPAAPASGASPSAQACQRYRRDFGSFIANDILLGFKIVGGELAKPGDFPYMVAIGFGSPRKSDVSWRCGGTLISERYVLTAAHCITTVQSVGLQPVALRLGETQLEGQGEGEGGRRRDSDYGVAAVVLHPEHDQRFRYHDLALLRTDRPVALSAGGVRPACLPAAPAARPEVGAEVMLAAGWGAVDPSGFEPSRDLRKVQLTAVEAGECDRQLTSRSKIPRGIDDSMLCAFSPAGEDTCRGDSGGPLVVRANGDDTLVGVTSFGSNPCGGKTPGVYARTAVALPWIESVVWA